MTLLIGVPSKGRLQEKCSEFFERAGMPLLRPRGERDYRGLIKGVENVEVLYLSASEIAKELALGSIHFGVTGADLIYENIKNADEKIELVAPLKFGLANVVVAVPQTWIDVRTMADLDDVAGQFHSRHKERMRVATKYINLTRAFFAHHHISDYQIVESHGATEGAPASGGAELIVDITTTGATLTANALKILDDGVMLKSEATLVASLTAEWSEAQKATSKLILDRISSEQRGRALVQVTTKLKHDVEPILKQFALTSPFGKTMPNMPLTLHVPQEKLFAVVEALRLRGAETISTSPLELVFTTENPLYEKLVKRI